jgi:transposase
MSEKEVRRRFSREFKEEAVRLVTESGRAVAEVARNLGVHENSLYKWCRQSKDDPAGCFPGKGHLKPAEEELARLRRELADVKEEREILKKALAIFSKRRV